MTKSQHNPIHLRLWWVMTVLAGVGGLVAIVLGQALRLRGTDQIVAMISSLTADGKLDDNYTYMLRAADTTLWLLGVAVVLVAGLLLVMLRRDPGRSGPFARWNSTQFLTVFGGLSLGLNLALIASVPFMPWDDFQWYHQSAIDLLNGVEVTLGGRPTAFFPIGYPLFLVPFYAVFGPHVVVAQFLNVLLRLGTAQAMYTIALQATGRELIARATFIVIAFFPSLFFYTLVTCSDVLFMAICVCILRLMITMESLTLWRTALLGLLIGFGSSVRPVLLVFPLVLVIWYFVISRRPLLVIAHLALVLVLQASVLAPWTARNARVFGQFVPVSTNGGYNLYLGHNPGATGGFNSTGMPKTPPGLNEAERDRWYRDRAIAYIRETPGRLVPITAKKLLYLFMRDDQGVSTATKRTYEAVPAAGLFLAMVVSDLFYLVVLGLAVLGGSFLITRGRNRHTLLVLLYFVYHVVVYLPFFAMDRYHLPLLPVLSLLAVIGGSLPELGLHSKPAEIPSLPARAGV